MARYLAAITLIFLGLSGREMLVPLPTATLDVIADAAPTYAPPSLTAAVRYETEESALGWGSVDLSAHPEDHEFRVDVMLGAPLAATRWERCKELRMRVDGVQTMHATRYSGVPMGSGVYDAVSIELTIDDVRRMARAREVRVSLCGDVMTLPASERAALSGFVHRFEEMATYDGPPPPKPPRDLDGEPDDDDQEAAPPIAA